MDFRRVGLALATCLLLLGGTGVTAFAAPAAPGQQPLSTCSAALFDGDVRLGPQALPVRGEVGRELRGYERTGDLTVQQFLATYWDPTANGGQGAFRFPPANGYVIGADGQPEVSRQELHQGERIDRFGSEFGSFLAPEGAPYASRSIPPRSLVSTPPDGCNFHEYRVVEEFTVDTGPIAPWFAQPGGGRQFQLDAGLVPGAPTPLNVMWLVNNGFLQRLN
jgi:Tuberculosis necrotizing toxin